MTCRYLGERRGVAGLLPAAFLQVMVVPPLDAYLTDFLQFCKAPRNLIMAASEILQKGFGRGREGGGSSSGNKVQNHLKLICPIFTKLFAALNLICPTCPQPILPKLPDYYRMISVGLWLAGSRLGGWLVSFKGLAFAKLLLIGFDACKTSTGCAFAAIA